MKKLILILFSALLVAALLCSCSTDSNSPTPGDLVPTSKPTPHVSTGEEDVSSEYDQRLCTEYWLDTNSLHCCQFNQNRTYIWTESKKDAKQVSSGQWQLTKDDQNYFSLYMTDNETGDTLTLHEIEFYDSSIYAVDDDGNGVVWLTTEREMESET